MSSHVCNQCARTYEYTTDKGYSREFCSVTCDYSFIIDQLSDEVAYWKDQALGHIACEQHTGTHVGEMVECPFCVADRLRIYCPKLSNESVTMKLFKEVDQ